LIIPDDTGKPKPLTFVREGGITAQPFGAARRYRREPFVKGNTANLRHGAVSPALISAKSPKYKRS
jgi:hypothetical protein